MIHDLSKAIAAFRDVVDQPVPDHWCVEIVTGVFDWRMRALDETGDISADESEQLSTNCDQFLFEAGKYLEAKGGDAKREASAIADHIASFVVECEEDYGKKEWSKSPKCLARVSPGLRAPCGPRATSSDCKNFGIAKRTIATTNRM
jgi:hypothetical protein